VTTYPFFRKVSMAAVDLCIAAGEENAQSGVGMVTARP
jgi:hypothetical protein